MTVVFYDGVCGLCNRLVRFLVRRDRRAALKFAPLQGDLARETLPRHDIRPEDLDSVVVVTGWRTERERVSSRSTAIRIALIALGGPWKIVGAALRFVPLPLADVVYRFVARKRYATFGKFESCPIPPPEWRDRFLE